MSARTFEHTSRMPATAEAIFAWHARPGALERLTPPWEDVRVLGGTGGALAVGSRVELSVPLGPLRRGWTSEHTRLDPGRMFEDVQVAGPFAEWRHEHLMEPAGVEPAGSDASTLTDRVHYRLPMSALSGLLAGGAVERRLERRLERTFAHRHRILREDLERGVGTGDPLRVVVSGASGLVGSALVPFLSTAGCDVQRLVRRAAASPDEISWSPAEDGLSTGELEGADAVVHLAGENVASGRWSAQRKERIRASRVDGTRLLAGRLAACERPPRVLVCASAVGFYGDRGEELLDEQAAPGEGFLAETCRAWEAAADPARAAGIRVVHLRFGVVLTPRGGALMRMLMPFRLGAGGRLGSGRQLVSWIGIDDAVDAIDTAIRCESLAGPVNAVAPQPVTNAELTRVLARVLRRPAILPMPAVAARAAFGEMASELLLASQGAVPRALEAVGFQHREPELERALRRLLGRAAPESAVPTRTASRVAG